MPKPESFPIETIFVPTKQKKALKPEMVAEVAESMLEIAVTVHETRGRRRASGSRPAASTKRTVATPAARTRTLQTSHRAVTGLKLALLLAGIGCSSRASHIGVTRRG